VSRSVHAIERVRLPSGQVRLARRVVDALGGRYSTELGIDVDSGDPEVERWFLAATLFGTRIASSVAERTFRVLDEAGLTRIAGARSIEWGDLVALLDAGGYTRYDFRTASRLHALADAINERHDGKVANIGRTSTTYTGLRDTLDALPGWGPVTIGLFLRDLRGIWLGADPPIAERAERASHHLGLVDRAQRTTLPYLERLADACQVDLRDLESGLVRLSLAHHNHMDECPGDDTCTVLADEPSTREPR
jgi:hypothetical protein